MYSQNNILLSFNKLDDEPYYDLKRLTECYADDTPEKGEYLADVSLKVNSFLNEKEFCYGENYKEYIGDWYLKDSKNNSIQAFFYSLGSHLIIVDNKENLLIINLANSSLLKKGKDSQVYFYTQWLGALRQLKFIDGKLYSYILDGDKWILDPIHENGKYFFIKE